MELEKLYKEVHPKIFAFFYARTQNRQHAEDLTQEVFYYAIKNFHTFSGKSTIETWLFSIAKNRLSNFYQSKKYKQQLLEKIAKQDSHEATPEQQFLKKERTNTLMEAIQKLDDLQREIVTLRIFGELSFKEIATLVNKSENHTRIIFHRAKLKILKELDDERYE